MTAAINIYSIGKLVEKKSKSGLCKKSDQDLNVHCYGKTGPEMYHLSLYIIVFSEIVLGLNANM